MSSKRSAHVTKGFETHPWAERIAAHVHHYPNFWIRLAALESKLLALSEHEPIQKPVYICGLARSGTTIMLEAISRHRDVATHRYRDFPFVFLPYFWNRILDLIPRRDTPSTERSHKDRIRVSPESPEAMEEMLWMGFWNDLHDQHKNNCLTEDDVNPEFDRCYRQHIRKLLLAQKRSRYVSKSNYNITRMRYLHRLFPDARFVVMVRSPEGFVASSMKQHRLFSTALKNDAAAISHLKHVGHYEFGNLRQPINNGDPRISTVTHYWENGQEAAGWALYWSIMYDYLLKLQQEPGLRNTILIVRYEDFCAGPEETLATVLAHSDLQPDLRNIRGILEDLGDISQPDYYRPEFSREEGKQIRELTAATADMLGYIVST